MKITKDNLKDYWDDLTHQYIRSESDIAYESLVRAYDNNRFYHNLDHIINCLNRLENCRESGNFNHSVVAFAIFFHDVVYFANSQKGDNENRSAKLAERFLGYMGMNEAEIAIVSMLIKLSTHEEIKSFLDLDKYLFNVEIAVFLDIDFMSGLDVPYEEFLKNGENIRKEYYHLDDKEFNEGRKKFLGDMLHKENILFYLLSHKIKENIRRFLTET